MVLKLHKAWFYSALVFENDVKMYGTQTLSDIIISYLRFENDVKMYGTQTQKRGAAQVASLRMM